MNNTSGKGAQRKKSSSVQKGGKTTPVRECRKQLAPQYKPLRPKKSDKK